METLFDIKTEITFGSNFGYVSPRTVDAAIRKIRKADASAKERYGRGKIGNGHIVYLNTSLTSTELRKLLTDFIQKYDHLKFYLTVK